MPISERRNVVHVLDDVTGLPFHRTSPVEGIMMPHINRMSVVFPLPLAPTIATDWPLQIAKLASRRATIRPSSKSRPTCSKAINGCVKTAELFILRALRTKAITALMSP